MSGNHQNCDRILELIPEYAFGLTDSEETRLVRTNLAQCPDAVTALAEYNRLKSDLRRAVPQIDPPAALRERLMASVSQTGRPSPKIIGRRVLHFHRGWLVAGLALALLISSNLFWLARVNDLSTAIAQSAGQDSQKVVFTLASTDGLRLVRLPSGPHSEDGWAIMMWSAESKTGLLCAWRLPQLAGNKKIYQLWLTVGNEQVSAGTFNIDTEGRGVLIFRIMQPIDKFAWALITAEPESGSDSPSDQVVVRGKISM